MVALPNMAQSLASFGERFLRRIFTDREATWVRSDPGLVTARAAELFAAKEAVIKALGPMAWREIDVAPDGSVTLPGSRRLRAVMAHTNDYASAIVIARLKD